jgi:hypothetical protein
VLAGVWFFPMSFVGVYAASGWPMWVSLNSDFGMLASTIASALVFVQAALIVMVVAKIVGAVRSTAMSSSGSPSPVENADSPTSPGGGTASLGSR